MRKSGGVRVHHKEERWGESSPLEKERWVRVDHEKMGDGVRVDHRSDFVVNSLRDGPSL